MKRGSTDSEVCSEKERRPKRNLLQQLFACGANKRRPQVTVIPQNHCVSKKFLVLDLDETLVHSSFSPETPYDFQISTTINGTQCEYFVKKRPHLEHFLATLSEVFELVVFTSSLQAYADPVIDEIDTGRRIQNRFFRDDCVSHGPGLCKNLHRLGVSLDNLVLLDNSPSAFALFPDNGVPIESWFGSAEDFELKRLVPFLQSLATVQSIPAILSGLRARRR